RKSLCSETSSVTTRCINDDAGIPQSAVRITEQLSRTAHLLAAFDASRSPCRHATTTRPLRCASLPQLPHCSPAVSFASNRMVPKRPRLAYHHCGKLVSAPSIGLLYWLVCS